MTAVPGTEPTEPRLPAKLASHPSVQALLARREAGDVPTPPKVIDAAWLKELCLASGADDAAAVSLDHPDLAGEREHVLGALPGTRTLIAMVFRMNRDNCRSPARSVANQEFHQTDEQANHAARAVTRALQDAGHRALNPSAAFPQEMDRFPGRIWVVAHKTVAVAAGLGVMGLHRNVIHPKFGNFVLLATVLVDAEVGEYGRELDYNPCIDCKLCVAVCPVGAIDKGGAFDALACATHNYREFMSGFTDWVQTVADSEDAADYRSRVTDSESASMWQSLSSPPGYKSGYCLAVCPGGEDVLGPYLDDRKNFMDTVLRPLQDKTETLYVLPGSHAQEYARRRFPHKPVKEVTGGWQPPAKRSASS
ncbi:4Fe-4S binding protein [Streptomyces acidiscabies]|uniref:4Fe-4S binding protein n=1 Tax=Streptomyces acidiscabies TaxID=42234 RepID=A0AAP6EIC1_9ACTN|nr:4Fe-4S binding protein [Streptomyces acidiscabies]MBP5942013.1 (4Fe-4S)-binding protein [Streptomyces sp. LBUM 1476]MBZ3913487.1 4Fe-4S binding protein [Streptomyces acidiscabies]MDX2963320.1 4Fe-4S binding protein [Streptomyces acidiscabies]MDX3023054.1 4Fe-4S binding protein [Streptomyces acidiscabies]MDX3792802.1 4Fe-4S binding protein [Streptomyces acidiscabies]